MKNMRVLCVSVLLVTFVASEAATLHVVPAGTPGVSSASPYDTWETAATKIQTAINAAQAGDTVLVTNGLYAEVISVSTNITVRSVNGAATTILDGENIRQLVVLTHSNAVIEGFTITRGTYAGDGGGVRCLPSGGILRDCIVSNNWAGGGGGIVLQGPGFFRLINCRVTANTADTGGGIRIRDTGDFAVLNSHITANTANNIGGIWDVGGCLFSNCVINGNVSLAGSSGGGLGVPWSVDNCVIASNTCVTEGGGVYMGYPSSYISNSLIFANTAGNRGGGVHMGANSGRLDSSWIYDNYAATNGGGVMALSGSILQNCLFYNNRAGYAGGGARLTRLSDGGGYMASCTIVGNQADTSGGGLFLDRVTIAVTNTIVAFNSLTSGGSSSNIYAYGANTRAFWHSCCPDFASFEPGQGNLKTDPGFVDVSQADYHLLRSSPCVDSGINQLWMDGATDLDGNPRIDSPDNLAFVDMGCFEYKPMRGTLLLLH